MTDSHLALLTAALRTFEPAVPRLQAWGTELADVLTAGGRLLACGNGGSAEPSQHLTAELVGRYQDDRQAFAALPLHADFAALTAIGNDYGAEIRYPRRGVVEGETVGGELLYAERIAVVGDDRHELVDPPADVGLALRSCTPRSKISIMGTGPILRRRRR